MAKKAEKFDLSLKIKAEKKETRAGQKKGIAITGMVLGILSIILFFTSWVAMIIGIAGIILSIITLKKANKDPKNYGGRGMAIAGIICGAVGLVLAAVVLVITIVFISYLSQMMPLLYED